MNNRGLPACIFVLLFSSIIFAGISYPISTQNVTVNKVDGYAKFTGSWLNGDPGCPKLPAERYVFLVPPDADLSTASFQIQGIREIELSGTYKVKPALPPGTHDGVLLWPKNRNIVEGKDVDVYSTAAFYPDNNIQDVKVGEMRCYKLVEAKVYFSRFNPVTKKLKCITEGNLVLNIKRNSLKKATSYTIPMKFKKLARKLVVNYDEIAPLYNLLYSFTKETKYVIMTESSIQSSSTKLEALKESKANRGFDVEIITESTWGGGTGDAAADNMREWLQSNYAEMGIEYVLFIGSSIPSDGTVPMKVTQGNMDVASDYYYQDLSQDWSSKDAFPEVSAGRIPVYDNDITTLDGILQKIIDYENASTDEVEWRFNALFAEKPFDGDTPGSNMMEGMRINFLEPQGWTCYRIYDDDNGSPDESSCSETAVKNAWNAGNYGLVEWMTHGSPTGASSIMKSNTTPELEDGHPPFVYMGSCSNGTIDNSNNLAFAMLKNAGIGSVGATEVTLYDVGKTDNYDSTNYIQGGVYEFARGIVADSLGGGEALDQVTSSAKSIVWHNALAYNFFGCPDVGVYTYIKDPFIEVSSPNGGEKWESDRTFTIRWRDNIDGKVKIELLKGGSVAEALADAVESNGSFEWVIDKDFKLGTDYKIRITSVDSSTLTDESDAVFTVEKKTMLILKSPNGGEIIEKGSAVEIKWEDSFDGDVTIGLFKEEKISFTVSEATESDGSFDWTVSDVILSGDDYKVRIAGVEKPWLFDESDNVISVQSPMITELPYVQNFDTFEEGGMVLREYWEQRDGDNLDWTVWTGMTPTKDPEQGAATGPDGDHTSGSGNYLYVESSGSNNPEKKADIITPMFDFRHVTSAELSFWYHMFSDNEGVDEMGHLYLDINIDGTWQNDVIHLEKDHGDEWFEETVDLTDYAGKCVQFRYRAVTGSGWASDVCIDDFKIDGTVPIITNNTEPVSGTPYFRAVPNPADRNGEKVVFDFDAIDATKAQITIYDALENSICEIEWKSGEEKPAWNLRNYQGKKVAGGSYLAVLWLTLENGALEQRKVIVGVKEDQ